jgi:hypothetical protein
MMRAFCVHQIDGAVDDLAFIGAGDGMYSALSMARLRTGLSSNIFKSFFEWILNQRHETTNHPH